MSGRALLYGATGFTGREIAGALRGTELVLGGRNPDRVKGLARSLDLDWRAAALDDPLALDQALKGISVVLHAAGPFADTARPMLEACLRAGVHYLDLNGEWPVFVDLLARDADARAAGIMVMPGVGLTIAVTDGLMALAKKRWPDTVAFKLAVSHPQVITGGSVSSAARLLSPKVIIRRDGALTTVPSGRLVHAFDFGDGLVECAAMSWADAVTGELSTGVANIEVYSEIGWPTRVSFRASSIAMALSGTTTPWRMAGEAMGALWPAEPSRDARDRARFVMAVEALDAWRRPRRMRMITYDGYTASVLTAVAAIHWVLAGEVRSGFQTPSVVFGPDFVIKAGAAVLERAQRPEEATA